VGSFNAPVIGSGGALARLDQNAEVGAWG